MTYESRSPLRDFPIVALSVAYELEMPGTIKLLAVFLGCLTAFEVPARQSFVVELAGKEDLMSAIALDSSPFNMLPDHRPGHRRRADPPGRHRRLFLRQRRQLLAVISGSC